MNVSNTKNCKRTAISDMVYIAMFTAIISVCSQISIPFAPIPFTLQTLGVFITAAILGCKRGTICVFVYILLGLIGVPVFAGFSGGIGSLTAPDFGYIIGFIFTSVTIGLSTKTFGKKLVPLIISMTIGLILCYIVGTIWFMTVYNIQRNGIDLAVALGYCVIPFLIPDGCKIAAAAILVNRLDKIIKL